jgi:hypothetical protein
MSFISWVIGGLITLLIIAMFVGFFGVFFYEQASSGMKSIQSAFGQLKGGRKK